MVAGDKRRPACRGGHFEPRVRSRAAVFAGAARSELPQATLANLRGQAIGIAHVLQQLGYHGRCRFDAVICPAPGASEVIHWMECNCRWGGVSIPMTAPAHLVAYGANSAISIVQETEQRGTIQTVALRKRLAERMFSKGRRDCSLIILSPSEGIYSVSINLLAIAGSKDEADNLLAQAMQRIGGV